ncbi:putative branched-chain-amino-acid aminotransferase [Planctomycetes bacterium Poly30]|uniref:branched-chain-amino-acid transaminase n=1 Tax=Saltatorellus ferox TaxID=2528018 RepID=A0A518EZT4_9BACT|nr:putative branched-chain-amino-acid aminotransferase [Planctomycetes bacterium Poly30]
MTAAQHPTPHGATQTPGATQEQRLYAACPENGARLLEFHPSLGSASNAINQMPPGVYEGLRTFERSKYFGLRTHLDRLKISVDGFKKPLDYDEDALVAALHAAALDATAAFDSEARVRVDVCAGPATTLGSDSNILLALTPFRGLPEAITRDGAYLQTACGLARPFPGVKTSDFIPLREAWITAHGDPDAYEYLMVTAEGALLEGTQSNVCYVKDGAVYAAPSGILPGVTQRTVLALARENGIEVREEFVHFKDLESFDESFMTTSVRSVVPISRIDQIRFAVPGPVTARLGALYDAFSAQDAVVAAENRSAKY